MEETVRARRPPHTRSQTTPSPSTLHALLTEQEASSATKTRPTRSGPFLLKWAELPAWQQDNQYILTHYRPATYSYMGCFQSLFYLHNESVNIHSHLSGAFVFLFIALSVYTFEQQTVQLADIIAFGSFFLGAVICLGISATYHAVSNHSPEVSRYGNQLDYVGIVALITGSFIPSIYYGFHCEPVLQKIYWSMISTIGTACTVVSVRPKFRTPKWRPFRAGMFVAMGLSAVFPVIHGLWLYGLVQMNSRIGLTWLVLQGALYIIGAGLYAARFPERMQPGKFDVWGSSHQIFHVLILFAALSHLIGLMTALDHVRNVDVCRDS